MLELKKKDNYIKRVLSLLSQRQTLILAIILALLIPFPTTIIPEWRVKAVDKNGSSSANAIFRQSWAHYSYDVTGTEFRTADENGFVVFPKRTFIAPLAYRVVRSGFAYLLLIAHGSVGPSASINAIDEEGKCSSDLIDYKPSMTMPTVVVVDC